MEYPFPPAIGGIPLDGRLILGPMAGITSLPYREFMRPFGISLAVTEMISDCGILYGNKKTKEYFATSEGDRPLAVQLFGFSLENSLKAIEVLEKEASYDFLDLNFGCPVPKVTKTGAGSSWLKREGELGEYVAGVVRKSKKPVTAKIRLGWDENSINVEEICRVLENSGVSLITVHARTRAQGYSGLADFRRIEGLGRRLSVPLAISGDVKEPCSSMKAMELTGASFLMLARYGVGDPLLAKELSAALDGHEETFPRTVGEQAGFALEYLERMVSYFGERTALGILRGVLPKFFRSFPGDRKIRREFVETARNIASMRATLKAMIENNCY